MKHTHRVFLIAFALLVLAGCQAARLGSVGQADIEAMATMSTPELLQEADAAFADARYARSELYYSRLLERADLPASQRPLVYERLAQSALAADHPHQAKAALGQWAEQDDSVLTTWAFNRLYLDSLLALDKADLLERHRQFLLSREDMPWDVRMNAGLWFAHAYVQRDEYAQAVRALAESYAMAPDDAGRAAMERGFYDQLREMDPERLTFLAAQGEGDVQPTFPTALASFELARRQAGPGEGWAATWRVMRTVVGDADLADKAQLVDMLSLLEARYGVPRVGVALALPITGRFAEFGRKVVRGAGLAQWLLVAQGVELDIRVVNTDAPGWEERLAGLPPYYTIVGGPIRVEAFQALAERGTLHSRVEFAFLPSLGDLAEGQDAWRFFPGPRDQVRSLLDMTVNELGINRVAVFYPDERFGVRMAEMFREEAARFGATVAASGSYPPGEHTQWNRRVAELLHVPAGFSQDMEAPLPLPDFGAVFLPDGWRQAQLLAPNFFFYESEQLVFLGPELWSRGVDASGDVEEQYFRLSVCPGSWWPESEGAIALSQELMDEGLGEADFWVALGYDFVHLAVRLGVFPAGWTPQEVNARLAEAQDMRFSMAPMFWDEAGQASTRLYLFSLRQSGKILADPEALRQGVARAEARREQRIEAYRQRQQAGH